MEELIKLAKKIKSLDRDKILIDIYKKKQVQNEIVDANRIDQLYNQGIDANGNALPAYSATTVAIKRAKGQPTDRTTLKDTGEFYKSFELQFSSDLDVQVGADDTGKDLFERYGENILGFTKENKEKLVKQIQDEFTAKVKAKIFGALE